MNSLLVKLSFSLSTGYRSCGSPLKHGKNLCFFIRERRKFGVDMVRDRPLRWWSIVACENAAGDGVCELYAGRGACETNAVWMFRNCWKSCVQCRGPTGQFRGLSPLFDLFAYSVIIDRFAHFAFMAFNLLTSPWPDLSVWRPWAGSLLEAPTHPQML